LLKLPVKFTTEPVLFTTYYLKDQVLLPYLFYWKDEGNGYLFTGLHKSIFFQNNKSSRSVVNITDF